MNNRQLVEIAALVSAYSEDIIAGTEPLPRGALEKFWDRSQRRLKLWLSSLIRYQRRCPAADPLEHQQLWDDLKPVLIEIFVSEVLTRVWCATLTAMDQARGTHTYEAIARNVLIGHLDARKRALQLLVTDKALSLEDLGPIDSIRCRVERWTDLLLGNLIERYQVDDFAFDPERAREYAIEQLYQSAAGNRDQVWRLLLLGLQTSFPTPPLGPPHEVIHEEIIASILACLPPTALPGDGPFQPVLADRTLRRNPTRTITSLPKISFQKLRRRDQPE